MQSASTNITTFPGKVGISNANPTHTLAIGSNVYVDDTGSNKLTVTGVISGDGLGVSNIQTTNVLGLTDNVTRITTLETDLDNNSSRITNLSSNLSDNSSRITNLSSNLSDNSSRITALESGDISLSGDKTFTGDITVGSNLEVGTANLFVDTTTSNVGVGVSSPAYKLDVGGDINIASNFNLRIGGLVPVFSRWTANGLDIYRPSDKVGIGVAPSYKLDVAGDINFTGSLLQNGSAFQGSKWSTSGSDIYRSSGNVGIGTSSPTRKLQLGVGSGQMGGYLDTYLNYGVVGGMVLGVKQSGGTEKDTMYISDSGLVGIGTNNPDRPLHVYNGSGHCWVEIESSASGGDAELILKSTTSQWSIWNNGSDDSLRFYEGGDRVVFDGNGRVGIGTTSPLAPLDIPFNVSGQISVNQYQGGYYFTWNTPDYKYYNSPTDSVAINADGGWIVSWGLYCGYSIQFLSDRRIKKDIREIDDESALEQFRLLKPSKYKYIEPAISGRTDKEVYGFIAQEVAEVLPEGVSIGGSANDGTNQGHIPNIMSMCRIESQSISSDAYENLGTEQKGEYTETGNTYTRHVVTITKTIDTSTFNADDSTRSYKFMEQTKTTGEFDKNSDDKYHPLVFYGKDLKTMRTNVVRVIDDSSFVVDEKIDLNKYEDDELLLYGQKPDDFYRLNKDAIFTLASAALQEVDRQLQTEKSKTATLETQVAALLARVTALENA